MKHISVIISENKDRALQEGRCFEKHCEHCNFPIWAIDEKDMKENHLITIKVRDIHMQAILCNSCISDINNLMHKKVI